LTEEKNLKIRSETIADYPAIAAVNFAAFGMIEEGSIVVLQRQSENFDPELSLVAEVDGRVVGHVLFMPHRVQLLGETVRAVNLAPISILPEYQKRGIGGKLIEAGHNLAREKGYNFSFLIGHPTYYPRLGYLPNAYGFSALKVTVDLARQSGSDLPTLTTRPVQSGDGPALHRLWQANFLPEVDFSLDPGQALVEWVSPNPAVEAVAYLSEDGSEIVGYCRARAATPEKPIMFLAKVGAVARAMLDLLARKKTGPGPVSTVEFELPLHPSARLTAELGGGAECRTGIYTMACPLRPSLFDEYYAQVNAGTRPPGFLIWPTAFELN
jgi:predicted N-acetyltransferase YhbS